MSQRHKILIFNSLLQSPFRCYVKNNVHLGRLNRNAMAEYRLIKNFAGVETCLECGAIFYGRSNRKFCCDACKNKYHNRQSQDIRNRKLRVKTVLEKNYKILSGLLQENRLSVDLAELSLLGYNPEFVTTFRKTAGRTWCSCYDIMFMISSERIYNIHRSEYLDLSCL